MFFFVYKKFSDEQRYLISEVDVEKKVSCNVTKVLSSPDRKKLFKDKYFFITPSVVPGASAIREMIECAGGVVEKKRRPLKVIQEMEPYTYIVISCINDFHLVADLIKNEMSKLILITLIILCSSIC